MRVFKFQASKFINSKEKLITVLMAATKIEESKLRLAIEYGGASFQMKSKGKMARIYDSEQIIFPQDLVILNYDEKVLKYPPVSNSECLYETENYGIWFKEAGVMSQGSPASDHTSLLRYVEKIKKKQIYLIHRLDRETAGPMIFGYNKDAAHKLSVLFQDHKITKTYQAIVLGEMEAGTRQTIEAALDDKKAVTHFEVVKSSQNRSLLTVDIETGRLHQIRRHLDFIGHPVMGDPKYGQGNKNREGLKLLAKSLYFVDPWTRKPVEITVKEELNL